MEQDELLSDSSSTPDSPLTPKFISIQDLKFPKQRQWKDWPWVLLTIANYYIFFSLSEPSTIPEIPKVNGKLLNFDH